MIMVVMPHKLNGRAMGTHESLIWSTDDGKPIFFDNRKIIMYPLNMYNLFNSANTYLDYMYTFAKKYTFF